MFEVGTSTLGDGLLGCISRPHHRSRGFHRGFGISRCCKQPFGDSRCRQDIGQMSDTVQRCQQLCLVGIGIGRHPLC